jgi:outer membrane protein assembly factor BamE (lipoprotein component of BamABCDE complex)
MMAILDNSSSVSRIQSSSTGSGSQQSVTPNQLKWQDKQNWRKLRSGMSKDEVTDLLGEPDRIDKSTFFEDWRYGYRIITGSVRFSDNDKLDSWHEPQ